MGIIRWFIFAAFKYKWNWLHEIVVVAFSGNFLFSILCMSSLWAARSRHAYFRGAYIVRHSVFHSFSPSSDVDWNSSAICSWIRQTGALQYVLFSENRMAIYTYPWVRHFAFCKEEKHNVNMKNYLIDCEKSLEPKYNDTNWHIRICIAKHTHAHVQKVIIFIWCHCMFQRTPFIFASLSIRSSAIVKPIKIIHSPICPDTSDGMCVCVCVRYTSW